MTRCTREEGGPFLRLPSSFGHPSPPPPPSQTIRCYMESQSWSQYISSSAPRVRSDLWPRYGRRSRTTTDGRPPSSKQVWPTIRPTNTTNGQWLRSRSLSLSLSLASASELWICNGATNYPAVHLPSGVEERPPSLSPPPSLLRRWLVGRWAEESGINQKKLQG